MTIPLLRTLNAIVAQDTAAQVRCTYCRGSGETHSAERDLCCPACDGVGTRPADWREQLSESDDEPDEAEVARLKAIEKEYMR